MVASFEKSGKRKSNDAPKFNKQSKKPFKSKKEANGAARSEAVALQLEDDAPEFPRGGGGGNSSGKRHEIGDDDFRAEFMAEELSLKKGKRKKMMQKKIHTDVDDFASLFGGGGGISGKLPRYANKITLKNISPGMKLWGVVAEVNEKDLVISLPGGLRGLVRAVDAVDIVTDKNVQNNEGSSLLTIFAPGQLVACIVLQLDDDKKEKDTGKHKIWLSLRLSLLHKGFTLDTIQEGMVLTGYVKSIEDHGYILHFGLPSFMGFLPQNSQVETGDMEVSVGQLLQGAVRSIDKTRKVVYLSSDPDTVSKCVTKELKGLSIELLCPGMMVNSRVHSVLQNGIMLSFLTYFTGTVDMFHLEDPFPTKNWKDDYSQNKKVHARILFIDPSSRAVGLTLSRHLINNKAPPVLVRTGDIYDQSKVVRVDRGMGLLLEIPSTPESTPAYVNLSDVAEEDAKQLEKRFKEGSSTRVRILGLRQLEGVATGVLKASAFEGPVFTHSDVKPGMVVKAKIVVVDNFGAIVQFPGGMKALCPLKHMSEFEITKPGKKFKVGAELTFRVLGCKSKRITVTHKKTLVKSKLPVLCLYADAINGLVVQGWITKIEKHGCFVRFYNGVQGFAPRSELGIEPGSDPSSMYHVGQVVKCRVTSSVPASRRINLSFIIKPTRVSEEEAVKLGCLVSGVVDTITPHSVVICVKGKDYLKGTISAAHLADRLEHAMLLKSVIKPGYEFDQLLVLDIEANKLMLSAKYSLINAAQELPSDLSQIQPNSVIHGYICNIIESGCFVRFLGHLTGFSHKIKAMDEPRVDLSEAFHIGQSVRSIILDVNNEASRITVSLKQSYCSSTNASFIEEYFLTDEKIAKLQQLSGNSELQWTEGFPIGSVIEGTVQEAKDIGVVVNFGKDNNVLGFIPHNQLGGTTPEPASVIRAAVLDVSKTECLVDLSLKPEFINKSREEVSGTKSKKKRKRDASKELEMNRTVTAIVEIVKEHYLVLSIPEYDYAIGYASLTDYNTQKLAHRQFMNGESVIATVVALRTSSSVGRLLLLLKSVSDSSETSSSKRAKRKSSYNVGSLVQAEITEIKPLELRINFGSTFRGRIHITEVHDVNNLEEPFNNFKIGQALTARIVATPKQFDNKKGAQWELSIKPTTIAGSTDIVEEITTKKFEFSTGQYVTGYVYKVDTEWIWLTVSRHVNAQLFILDTACEPNKLRDFQKDFHVGKAISGHVLTINKEKKLLRIVQRPIGLVSHRHADDEDSKNDKPNTNSSSQDVISYIQDGDILGGRISKIYPGIGGLLVQIGPHMYGRVHYTELKDSWVSDPLAGFCEGQFVKCKVLEISHSDQGTVRADLSLRTSLDGMLHHSLSDLDNDVNDTSKRVEKIEDICPGMTVQGYVKNVVSKGCFITLSRKLDAKILVSNLSDGYIKEPEKEFPVGKLVVGRVLTVEPSSKRIEVTLKSLIAGNGPESNINDFSSLHAGDIISGRIRRVESYGLFITIGSPNLVGLCHISELAEDHVDNIESKYRAGDEVRVKILKVDEERRRISLGMKGSYFQDDEDIQLPFGHISPEPQTEHGFSNDTKSIIVSEDSGPEAQDMDTSCAIEASLVFADAESRACIPPLEVSLDDLEHSDMDNLGSQSQGPGKDTDIVDEKKNKRSKKKAKEEREREIQAAEERLLEKGEPKTADEHEKRVRTDPDSSLYWIEYMTFMLSLADVEKARSIAERALRTINMREESEKLNIWVAYFNLENEYGNPPEEAVVKIFRRALQYCDPEEVHLRLLGMYERTEQHKLADELLNKMIKKFKHSPKVWLRRIEAYLKDNKEDIQAVITRALVCLPQHEHIEFISQTAILEFKSGVPDRGRSLFEGILREYPKRTDLWSRYLDQEIKLGEVDVIRSLFERAISLSLPAKRMKFLFKKYLEFEKTMDDDERIEIVKQKAMAYVESTTG